MDTQVALVTGGARGIGRGISLALGQAGFAVVVNYNRSLAAADEVRQLIESGGGTAEVCAADITQRAHRDLLVNFVLEQFGRIDLLVNNAGISSPQRHDLLEATQEAFDQVLAVNLRGPFFLAQAVARAMIGLRQSGTIERGMIINIGSISAYTVSPDRGDYCVSKAGLAMMTQLFAVRLASEGIRVFEVRPGIVDTDMTRPAKAKYDRLIANGLTPISRWGQPEDVGRAVVALAEGRIPFSTGDVLNVDGGFHLRRL